MRAAGEGAEVAAVLIAAGAVLLTADPDVIARRLNARGGQSRFEQQPGSSHHEVRLYHQTAAELADAGWRRCSPWTPPSRPNRHRPRPSSCTWCLHPSPRCLTGKVERKRRWLSKFTTALDTAERSTLFLGHLHVLEPEHQPRYRFFQPFEYDFYRDLTDQHGLVDAFRHRNPDLVEHSWVGRTGDGYRYDHAHSAPRTSSPNSPTAPTTTSRDSPDSATIPRSRCVLAAPAPTRC